MTPGLPKTNAAFSQHDDGAPTTIFDSVSTAEIANLISLFCEQGLALPILASKFRPLRRDGSGKPVVLIRVSSRHHPNARRFIHSFPQGTFPEPSFQELAWILAGPWILLSLKTDEGTGCNFTLRFDVRHNAGLLAALAKTGTLYVTDTDLAADAIKINVGKKTIRDVLRECAAAFQPQGQGQAREVAR